MTKSDEVKRAIRDEAARRSMPKDTAPKASLGVDQRVSKAFTAGDTTQSASRLLGPDVSVGSAIIGDPVSPVGLRTMRAEDELFTRTADAAIQAGDHPMYRDALVEDTSGAKFVTDIELSAGGHDTRLSDRDWMTGAGIERTDDTLGGQSAIPDGAVEDTRQAENYP